MQLTEQYLHSAVNSVIRSNEINACLHAFFFITKMLMKSVLVVYEGSVYEIWCSVY